MRTGKEVFETLVLDPRQSTRREGVWDMTTKVAGGVGYPA